jgi:two-component system, OmpR family, sensor histidine kinase KdpD
VDEARAREIVEGRAAIASMLAHEFLGPVSTIRGLVATTIGSYDRLSDVERLEFLDLIGQEASLLQTIADQAALALKIEAGTLTFEMRPASLAEVVREGTGGARVGDHPVEIQVQDATLVCDRKWLAQVVRQLVDNAAKFSPSGSPLVVRGVAQGAYVVLEVADSGPGIPTDKRDALWSKFPGWRPSGYEDQPGSGLGLFICGALVAEHKGEISIEDDRGGGTILRVRLPVEG